MIVVGRFHYYTSDDLDHHFRRLQSNDLDDESQVQELQNQKLKITRITSTQQIDVLQQKYYSLRPTVRLLFILFIYLSNKWGGMLRCFYNLYEFIGPPGLWRRTYHKKLFS